jgi:predicted Zn-dependent protease
MDFSKTLIHCSSIGKLLTEPKSKADKEANELSATTKSHLVEVYARERYNFHKELDNKYIRKGNTVEQEAIDELSLQIRMPLEKNEETFRNEFFVGTPDVFTETMLFDVKSSYDWLTFLANIPSELDPMYEAQLNGYMDLLGISKGYIVYVLLDTPFEEIEKQKYYLFTKGSYISEESPEFLKLWAEKEKNFIFSNYPIEERILFFEVNRNQDLIDKAKAKVIKAREFLEDFHKKHKSFNENSIKNIIHELHKQQ